MRAPRARRAVLGLVVLSTLAVGAPARADTVTAWNAIASTALQGPGPQGAGQGAASMAHMAMVHGAVYDAVNAIDGGHEPYLGSLDAQPWYSQDAAVATAAYRVLVDSVPGLGVPAAGLPAIAAARKASLDAIPDGPAKAGGIATGEAAAAAMIAARAGDHRFTSFLFSTGTLAGQWRPVAPSIVIDPFSWLKDVTPFVLPSAELFQSRAQHGLTTRAYAADFAEVKAIGSTASTTRSDDQTAAAKFWGLTNGTASWSSIFRSVAQGQGGTLADHARLFAQLYANTADALIVTWGDKERYSAWRPQTAIRAAATDGNPATEADPGWTSLITAPPYPEHPSGLSAVSGAAVETLQHFYGTDEVSFAGTTVVTPASPVPVTRHYASFSQAVDEVVGARVWSGVHFRFSDEEGAKLGRRVAHWDSRHAFR